jgi:hypothetical protein
MLMCKENVVQKAVVVSFVVSFPVSFHAYC